MGTPAKEAHLRSILKAISYRLLAAIATTTIVFVFTRKLILSLGVGLVESVAKILCYYIHERAWSFIGFGKKTTPLVFFACKQTFERKGYGRD